MITIFRNYFPSIYPRVLHWNFLDILALLLKGRLKSKIKLAVNEQLQRVLNVDFQNNNILLFNSGTSALLFSLQNLKLLKPTRTEVLLPFYCCPSLPYAIKKAGLIPIFVGIDSNLCISPTEVNKSLKKQNILAVIVPHPYGFPAEIEEISSLVSEFDKDIFIIDDAAAAYGIEINGKQLGTYGDVGVLSFNTAKQVSAAGGGALIINNDSLTNYFYNSYDKIAEYRNYKSFIHILSYWWRFSMIRYSPAINYWISKYKLIAHTEKKKSAENILKMSTYQAQLILNILKNFREFQRKKLLVQKYYIQSLQKFPQIVFPQKSSVYPLCRFFVRIKNCKRIQDNDNVTTDDNPMKLFLEQEGIRVGYGYSYNQNLKAEGEDVWDNFLWLDELLWLPTNHDDTLSSCASVVSEIINYLHSNFDHSNKKGPHGF